METIPYFSNKVIGILVAIVVTVLVLVPLSNMGGTETHEQPGTRMAQTGSTFDKEYSDEYDSVTPIAIADSFYITYDSRYTIIGKGIDMYADTIQIVRAGSDVTVTYMADGDEHEYYATVEWLFVNDPNGKYSATNENINVNVNSDKVDDVYVVGIGQYGLFWAYNDGDIKFVREI